MKENLEQFHNIRKDMEKNKKFDIKLDNEFVRRSKESFVENLKMYGESIDTVAKEMGHKTDLKNEIMRNSMVGHPALLGFVSRLFEDQDEAPKYAVFNQELVGTPGDQRVSVPFINKDGRAMTRTLAQYTADDAETDTTRTRADIKTDQYEVNYTDTYFKLTDEDIKQVSTLSKRAGGFSINAISRQIESAKIEVNREIDEVVFDGFISQFGNNKPYPARTTAASTWDANATTGQTIYNEISRAMGVLINDGIFLPRTLIMHPATFMTLAKIVGTSGNNTVLDMIVKFMTKAGVQGGPNVVLTTRALKAFYLVDNKASNMIVGFTENIQLTRAVFGTNYVKQDLFAKHLGFVPTVNKAAVGISGVLA